MECTIDDISEVLAINDVKSILKKTGENLIFDFFNEDKVNDPIFHFYETFLAEYDPQTREKTGVYYTPESVVSYIIRSINYILKKHFRLKDGLADKSVTILDPAAGTLTFLANAIKTALKEFTDKYGKGGKESFIREHILRNFYAFEFSMAPYAIGHLRLSYILEDEGYKLNADERLKFYLTNALEMKELPETLFPGMVSLSQESHLAMQVKSEEPILVILGNPPYFGKSSNFGEWISKEIRAYYQVDGHPLNEKNPKWLQDDYVKFIRLAQWKIDQAGEGVLGFITNNGYLDNPTFRGMRQSLMNGFDEIYILDLHGNSLKKDKCPDGSKDENVFDIQQGVAISIFIKKKNGSERCKVYHSEIWGMRELKYGWLKDHDISITEWKELSPKSDFYFFIPRNENFLEVYEKYIKVTDIFLKNSIGISTAKDSLTIKWTPDEVWKTVSDISELDVGSAKLKYDPEGDSKEWKVEFAQKDLIGSGPSKDNIIPILYRPFDVRYTYYTGKSNGFICRPRSEVMHNMIISSNLALTIARSNKSKSNITTHFLCSNKIIEAKYSESTAPVNIFPLYFYIDSNDLNSKADQAIQKQPNIYPVIFNILSNVYGNNPTPEDIFYYIYAVLYSNTYRIKYSEFIKDDFPRVPFTRDYELFSQMGSYGKRLTDLHLLESSELDTPIARFDGEGDGKVEKLRYDEEQGRVYINSEQYFEGVTKEIWEYHVGGYQVCQKWLKDRKNRELSLDEIKQYCKIVTALQKTMEIQKLIDAVYTEVEKELIEFSS